MATSTLPRPHRRLLFAVVALSWLVGLVVPAAQAQENYNFTVTVLGGAGGSLDVDPDPGFSNPSFAIGLMMITEPRTQAGIRAGTFSVSGDDETFGGVADAQLDYATLGGEYRLNRGFYDSGLFAGVGAYRLGGTVLGEDWDETSWGGVVGVSGEFRLARWVGFQIEFAGHYTDLDAAQFLVFGHAGFAFHF